MFWTSNICRICAQIGEACIPIFEKDAALGLDSKMRRCLMANVSKDDLKPKQLCQACFAKLNDFYNFVALFHESNYRFEALLYQSAQSANDCADIDLSIAGKTESLPDCSNLSIIEQYKDEMLPLENLDVQARDFGEQNILNDIVANSGVDINIQNFANDSQLYVGVCNSNSEDVGILRDNLNKIDNLQASYLAIQQDGLTGSTNFVKTEKKLEKNVNLANHTTKTCADDLLQNYAQNFYTENILINDYDGKKYDVNVGSKKLGKVSIISSRSIHKSTEKQPSKYEVVQTKSKLRNSKKIDDSECKLQNVGMQADDFAEPNILNDIVSHTAINPDDIEIQNFVADADSQLYTEIGSDSQNLSILRHSNDGNLSKINDLQAAYIDLGVQNSLINTDYQIKSNKNPEKRDVNLLTCANNFVAPGLCRQNNFPECIVIEDSNDANPKSNTNRKRRSKVNIISVKTIRKAMEKQLKNETAVKSRPRARCRKKATDSSTTKPRRFPCNTCGKSFARRQCLNEHFRKHGTVRPYICDNCGKTFAVQWDLTFHKRVHTDQYSCQVCGKCFSAPSKLQRHVRTHTGERPFVCSVETCRRSFSDKRNLIGHQITHTNVRKFTCDKCSRSYKTKSQLKDHMQAHSDSPVFKCTLCNKQYRWKTNLVSHVKKHDLLEALLLEKSKENLLQAEEIKKECP